MVQGGVTGIQEMRRHLKLHVKHIFDGSHLPERTNKRYYPRDVTIKNAMSRAKRQQRKTMVDQECLVEKISEWKSENPALNKDCIFFRPKGETDDCSTQPNLGLS